MSAPGFPRGPWPRPTRCARLWPFFSRHRFSSRSARSAVSRLNGPPSRCSGAVSCSSSVLLLSEVVSQASTQLWLALAASSTPAGNATILGAARNVLVVQIASRDGVTVSMNDFVKAGFPVTAATLVLSTVLISVLVPG